MSADCCNACVIDVKDMHPINFAYAHNEKSSPVTVYNLVRYVGVQIVNNTEFP